MAAVIRWQYVLRLLRSHAATLNHPLVYSINSGVTQLSGPPQQLWHIHDSAVGGAYDWPENPQ